MSIIHTISDEPQTENLLTNPVQYKNPLIPSALSLFFPGIGQVYNGVKGIQASLAIFGILFLYSHIFLLGIPAHAYVIYESYNTRKKMNEGDIPVKSATKREYSIYFITAALVIVIFIFIAIFSKLLLIKHN